MKTCSKCGVPKEENEFLTRSDTGATGGLCIGCRVYYQKGYNKTLRVVDPEKGRVATRKWRAAHPEQSKKSNKNTRLKSAYGIDIADLERMTLEQQGCCAICDQVMTPPCVDHCHATGKVRALLCGQCNVALGGFKDSPRLCIRASEYLKKFSS